MKKAVIMAAMAVACALTMALAGCSASSSQAASSSGGSSASSSSASAQRIGLADGTYSVDVKTDSSMFRVNEANKGKGTMVVADGKATVHMSLVSKKITNLYAGTAEQAKSDSSHVINPVNDTVTYSDGSTEEVYGFDVPVPALDQEFDVAIYGEKGKWYDHKVSVSNPVAM